MRTARAVVLALVLGLPLLLCAQRREGVYVPAGGSGTPWSINENHALIWGGHPYMPVGLSIDGSPASVARAQAAGIKDVLVDLPASGAGWDEAIAALKAADMRYLIRIDSLGPMAKGIAVEPQAYRIAGITKPTQISVDLPGATGAFVVVASRRDSSVSASGYVPVIDGKLNYLAKGAADIEHVVLIYPEASSMEQPDYWETLDRHRDLLLSSLKRHSPGPGFRGLVNPLGKMLSMPGRELRFVPTSPYFRMELRDIIEKRYRSLKTAMLSWGLGPNDLESFDDLARLVPLWQGARGVGLVLDPSNHRTYTCDNKRSTLWSDLSEAVSTAATRRFSRFVAAIRSVVDAPVTQEWSGWASPYESSSPLVDGIGMRVVGATPTEIVESAARPASTAARWNGKGWFAATDIDLGGGSGAEAQLPAVIDDLGSLGAKAFFLRGDSPALLKAIATEAARRQADESLADMATRAVFFPENARNPATAQRLTGGQWWLPAPLDGNRIDLGSLFYAYRMNAPTGSTIALWAKTPGRYRLRMASSKGAVFTSVDGRDPAPKQAKGGVEVFVGEMPLMITGTTEVPIPELAFYETIARFDVLMAEAERRLADVVEERIFFKDYISGFDRNPGGNYPQMRIQVDRVGAKIGDVTWIEGEQTSEQNFSEAPDWPGCSGGRALVLMTPLDPGPQGYFAEYKLPVRSSADQEVWLAAAVPLERRGDVTVTVNGQVMTLSGSPVSLYGDGFGWYKLGVTKLAGSVAKARVQVIGSGANMIAIDALTLTPRPFVPNGITPPDPIAFPPLKLKPL